MADIYFRPDGANRFQIRSANNGTLPSAWLDQEFNRIYVYLNTIEGGGSSATGSEWQEVSAEATQGSTTTFTLEGDYTSVFESGRAIRLVDDNQTSYNSHIQNSNYVGGTNTTTVTIYDAVVPATIEGIYVGLIGKEAQNIPSMSYVTKSSAYTIKDSDQIVFVNDSTIGSLSLVYDDEQVNGSGYYALLITLPQPSYVPGKLLCIKKIAGTYQTIVSSGFTHTTEIVDTDTIHHNTYSFQIYGDTTAKNRVTLKGIGDCYWLVSDGNRWQELTPEASETVKGIVRMATEEEMSLTAEQMENEEELSKNLAVSPYQVDKAYMRTDGSNLRFASNFIYKSPNGTAALINNNIVVYSGLGISIPKGRDENGVLLSEKVELAQNHTFAPVEVTSNKKLLFINYDESDSSFSLQSILAKNYYMSYGVPSPKDTTLGDYIIWFDYGANLLKLSTDNGTNWTTFNGAGPICKYAGNGTYITSIQSYSPVGFVSREDLSNFAITKGIMPSYSDSISGTASNNESVDVTKDSFVYMSGEFSYTGNVTFYASEASGSRKTVGYFYNDRGSNTWYYSCTCFVESGGSFSCSNSSGRSYSYIIYPLKGAF
jgi:hypothetical protein